MALDWEQQFAAIQALVGPLNASIRMREPGDWYVDVHDLTISNGVTKSSGWNRGINPRDAVENYWEQITTLKDGEALCLSNSSRYYRWTGFMWADVTQAHTERYSPKSLTA